MRDAPLETEYDGSSPRECALLNIGDLGQLWPSLPRTSGKDNTQCNVFFSNVKSQNSERENREK